MSGHALVAGTTLSTELHVCGAIDEEVCEYVMSGRRGYCYHSSNVMLLMIFLVQMRLAFATRHDPCSIWGGLYWRQKCKERLTRTFLCYIISKHFCYSLVERLALNHLMILWDT